MAKILVAGQDAAAIDAVSASIEVLGHETISVESATDVVGEVIEHAAAMVVLDEHMETFDGFEVAAMLRADPDIVDAFPILLLVSLAVDSRKLDKAGVTETFVKDRDSAEFEGLLLKCLGDEAGTTAAERDPLEFLEP